MELPREFSEYKEFSDKEIRKVVWWVLGKNRLWGMIDVINIKYPPETDLKSRWLLERLVKIGDRICASIPQRRLSESKGYPSKYPMTLELCLKWVEDEYASRLKIYSEEMDGHINLFDAYLQSH